MSMVQTLPEIHRRSTPANIMGIEIESLESLLQVCDMVAKSGIAPPHFNTRDKIFVAAQYGSEIGLGFQQSLQALYIVKGRVSMMGIDMMSLIQASGKLEWMKTEEIGEPHKETRGIRVTMKRIGQEHPFVGEFTYADANRGGNMAKDTYKGYLKDMLTWRAFARAAKGFADVTRGVRVYEEQINVPEPQKGVVAGTAVMAADDHLLNAPPPEVVETDWTPSEEELAAIKAEETKEVQNGV